MTEAARASRSRGTCRSIGEDTTREEASKENSWRVRGYIPASLVEEWEFRHYTARSVSVLLQEAMRAELERTRSSSEREGCGGRAEWRGPAVLNGDIGYPGETLVEVFTCTNCKKSFASVYERYGPPSLFQPSELEKYEVWRHDRGIVWLGEEEDEPTAYGQALKGFLNWLDYDRARSQSPELASDPLDARYIEAHTGKQQWDAHVAKRLNVVMDLIRREKDGRDKDEANGSEAAPPWDPDDDDTLPF
jgi:hypothetical protein